MDTYQPPGQPAGSIGQTRPASGGPRLSPRLLLGIGIAIVLLIVAAIVGSSISSGQAISVGDCVQTNPSAFTQWDIKKVACGSDPGAAFSVQKVESVINSSSGECGSGYTTFQDDPNGKTYCLSTYFGSSSGG